MLHTIPTPFLTPFRAHTHIMRTHAHTLRNH